MYIEMLVLEENPFGKSRAEIWVKISSSCQVSLLSVHLC